MPQWNASFVPMFAVARDKGIKNEREKERQIYRLGLIRGGLLLAGISRPKAGRNKPSAFAKTGDAVGISAYNGEIRRYEKKRIGEIARA